MKLPNGQRVSFGTIELTARGEITPMVEATIASPQEAVYFEHHTLLHKDPRVEVVAAPRQGMLKRFLGDLPIIQTETQGAGDIAFSRSDPGEIVVIPIQPGVSVDVMEHRFLLATMGVSYACQLVPVTKHISHYIDRFAGLGLLVLHAYGNLLETELAAGQTLDIDRNAFLWKDSSVQLKPVQYTLNSTLFGVTPHWMFRMQGPGRLGMQSK